MGTLYYLVGLPASGKSTYTHDFQNWEIHSSDSIRKELYGDESIQDNPAKVFEILNKRVVKDLKAGKSVVYDSTGISSKRRMAFLNYINYIDCTKVCIFFATPYEVCLERNKNRDRKVPEDVIKKMYKNIEIPYYYEGWDSIIIRWSEYDKDKYDYMKYPDIYNKYDQHNSHHTLTLGEHMKKGLYICDKMRFNQCVRDAIMLHDIGKPFCATYTNMKGETGKECHYYGHENVSAYDSLFILNSINSELRSRDYVGDGHVYDDYILNVCALINLHMKPYTWKEDKTRAKYSKLLGEVMFNDLMNLNYCDKEAH